MVCNFVNLENWYITNDQNIYDIINWLEKYVPNTVD